MRTLNFMEYREMMLFLSNGSMGKLISGRLKRRVKIVQERKLQPQHYNFLAKCQLLNEKGFREYLVICKKLTRYFRYL